MATKVKKSAAEAAAVLRIYEWEVEAIERDVVTTTDGQRYQLTGDQPGDYVWLKAQPRVKQILRPDAD